MGAQLLVRVFRLDQFSVLNGSTFEKRNRRCFETSLGSYGPGRISHLFFRIYRLASVDSLRFSRRRELWASFLRVRTDVPIYTASVLSIGG